MTQKAEENGYGLWGLYHTKGQSLGDIWLQNGHLSQEDVQTRIEQLLEQGTLTKYEHHGQTLYMLK